jgi:plastocyanin
MMSIIKRRRRLIAVVAGAGTIHACGGGGAAPLSEPNPPSAGAPAGTPPAQPATPAAPAPSAANITTPNRTFSPASVTVALNGTVTWQAVGDRHEIVFVEAAPAGGNIGALEPGASASRTFATAGSYEYECLRHRDKGMRGTVVVQSSSAGAAPPSGSTATVTTPNATFNPSDITIPAGGSVTWRFSEARHNVTFQASAPTGGNVPDQDPGTSVSRTFAVAGTYNYSCTRHSGMTGRVIVQ